MRFRALALCSAARPLVVGLGLCLVLVAAAAPPGDTPSRQSVKALLLELRDDPNLPGKEKKKTLQFKPSEPQKKEETPKKPQSATTWGKDFWAWLTDAARLIVWVVGALVVAFVLYGARQWVRVRGEAQRLQAAALPSHVGTLDIRPQSLPDEVGTHAWILWQAAQRREALSLLYRAALSRMVHQHAVPVRSSSTESEVLTLARPHLDHSSHAYVGQIVEAWQRGVYGAHLPPDAAAKQLCDAFSSHWPLATPRKGSAP